VSGGYDIPADQADVRATLTAPGVGAGQVSPPEIQIFAAGTPNALDRTVDVAALSSWLAVRAIDRETRRLDSIERGEATRSSDLPSIPPPAQPMNLPEASPGQPSFDSPSRQLPARPRVSAPRPPAVSPVASPPPAANSAAVNAPPAGNPGASGPVVSQQAPPLPPAIDVRPAPAVARPPRPKPPLMLTPPVATPQPAF
jgi:large subunit ribosomal protein L24